MISRQKIWNLAIVFSYIALLAALARTFLDYQYVYSGLGFNAMTSGGATLINLAMFGGWMYALLTSTRSSRRGMAVNLAFNALMLVFGVSTVVSLCPSPCPTGWPVGEITIWANVLTSILAVVLATMAVFRPAASTSASSGQMEATA
jgi:hypothetical protein